MSDERIEDRPGRDLDRCATCGDVADRATIVSIDGTDALATLESGDRIAIAVELTPDAGVGDEVLVHQGVAIGLLPRTRRCKEAAR